MRKLLSIGVVILSSVFLCNPAQGAEFHWLEDTPPVLSAELQQAVPKRPLILWLHGCTQNALEFLKATELVEKTSKLKPFIVTPQNASWLSPLRCWNFFSREMFSRSGEAMRVVSQIKEWINTGRVDPRRVYVGGYSSGATYTQHLAFCYPDVFKGALIHSGGPFDYFGSVHAGLQKALRCAGSEGLQGRQLKTLIYIHGTEDLVVPLRLGRRAAEQGGGYLDYLDDGLPNYSLRRKVINRWGGISSFYRNGYSIHQVEIQGLGHRWSGSKSGWFPSPYTYPAVDIFLEFTRNLQ